MSELFRVVTEYRLMVNNTVRNAVMKGPWHPDESVAKHWAIFFKSRGIYEKVTYESNRSKLKVEVK